MTVKEFVEKYVNSTDVEKTCAKHVIKDKYVPYEEKIATCLNIVKKTNYIESEGIKIYNRNTPAQYVQFSMTIINLYTDIEINFENILADFNMLDKVSAIDTLLSAISESEYTKFRTLLEMIQDDEYENNRNMTSYIDNFLQPFKAIINNEAFMNKIQEMLPTEE